LSELKSPQNNSTGKISRRPGNEQKLFSKLSVAIETRISRSSPELNSHRLEEDKDLGINQNPELFQNLRGLRYHPPSQSRSFLGNKPLQLQSYSIR